MKLRPPPQANKLNSAFFSPSSLLGWFVSSTVVLAPLIWLLVQGLICEARLRKEVGRKKVGGSTTSHSAAGCCSLCTTASLKSLCTFLMAVAAGGLKVFRSM